MPVQYVLVERGNPGDARAAKKFYAQFKSTGDVTTRQLVKEIAARSTVSAADVMAVVESLLEIIPEKLNQGQIVRLGDFGSFSATLSGSGAATPEEFVASSMITKYSIRFRPGRELGRAVAGVEYQKAGQ